MAELPEPERTYPSLKRVKLVARAVIVVCVLSTVAILWQVGLYISESADRRATLEAIGRSSKHSKTVKGTLAGKVASSRSIIDRSIIEFLLKEQASSKRKIQRLSERVSSLEGPKPLDECRCNPGPGFQSVCAFCSKKAEAK